MRSADHAIGEAQDGLVGIFARGGRADVGCRLLEVDFAGIENILTGWFMGDPGYIRYGYLGLHAGVTALYVGKPASLDWPDEQILAHLKAIKKAYPVEYDIIKHVDHGTGYGLTPYGMSEQFPKYFPTPAAAERTQAYLFLLAPGLQAWHLSVRKEAKDRGCLGGPPPLHPYGYRHWFWDVLSYKPTDEVTARRWLRTPGLKDRVVYLHGRPYTIQWGGDSKRVIAYKPQSTAAGRLKAAEWVLFGDPDLPTYIGDAYFGRTPLRAPIHDSLVLEVPNRAWDRVVETVATVMQAPAPELPCPPAWGLGTHLRIGVAAKGGRTWGKQTMEDIPVPKLTTTMRIEDPRLIAEREEDREDWESLQRVVQA
jgi:hypothetical protein